MGHVYVWKGGSGALSVAAEWADQTTGATALAAPGTADTATLAGAPAAPILATGALHVASLLVTGGVALTGAVSAGTLTDTGTLALANGAALAATGMNLAGTLSVDALSAAAIGTGASASAGTLAVGAGALLSGSGALHVDSGNIAVAGTLAAAGGALALFGGVTGSGTLAIGAGATLFATGTVGAGLTTAFTGAAGTLALFTAAAGFGATITGFATGDAIDIVSDTIVGAAWAGGTLTLTDAAGVALALAMPDSPGQSYDDATFLPLPDGLGGTEILLAPAGTTQATGNITYTVPAGGFVLLTGTAASVSKIVIGGVLAVENQHFATNSLTVTGTLAAVGASGYASAPTANVSGLLTAIGTRATAAVRGNLQLAGTFSASGGGWANANTIALAGGVLAVDAASSMTLGAAAKEAGLIAVPAGATIAGWGRIAAAADDAGLIQAQDGALVLAGGATGTGTLGIGAGATLFATGPVGAGLTAAFTGAAGTLELFTAAASFGATITGFTQGDAIDIAADTIVGAAWAGGTLTLTDAAGTTLALALPDSPGLSYDAATFLPLPDGFGGTEVLLAPAGTNVASGNITYTVPDGSAVLLSGAATSFSQIVVNGTLDVAEHLATNNLKVAGTLAVLGTTDYIAAPTANVSGLLTAIGARTTAVLRGNVQLSGTFAASGGGLASAATITLAGGTLTLDAASAMTVGTATKETGLIAISAGSTLAGWGSIAAPVDDAGLILVQGGALTLFGAVGGAGSVAIGAGATLDVFAPLAVPVLFGAGATLAVSGAPTLVTGTLGGFAAGDGLDLIGLGVDHAAWANGTLSLSAQGAVVGTLAMAGAYAGQGWQAQPDGYGGTLVSLQSTSGGPRGNGPIISNVPCFAAGTRIATPEGDMPVEALRPGDAVLTPDGPRRLRWVGRRVCDARAAPELRPVRIAAGALAGLLGAALPARDLWLSPQHALLLRGVLVPAVALVGGGRIRREDVDRIAYHHLGLDAHATVLAEGVAAETYLPLDAMAGFDAEWGARPLPAPPCAPRLEGGAGLVALRRLLPRAPARKVPPGPLRGHLERAVDLGGTIRLEGWAVDATARPVSFAVFRDGRRAGVAIANRWRPDLDRAGLAGGRCAFELDLPGPPGALLLRRRPDGATLPPLDA